MRAEIRGKEKEKRVQGGVGKVKRMGAEEGVGERTGRKTKIRDGN